MAPASELRVVSFPAASMISPFARLYMQRRATARAKLQVVAA